MRFRTRIAVGVGIASTLLLTFFLHVNRQLSNVKLPVQSSTLIRSANDYPKALPLTCAVTPVVSSSASLKTIELWDNIDISINRNQYQVKFPQEKPARLGEQNVDYGKLTVLIVPFSHNDPGWQKTVEDYYQHDTVNIFNTMVQKLLETPDMTMVWAETIFLSMWYERTTSDLRQSLKTIIDRGQFDIVTGGWVMPDEASTHYYAIIDQLIEGHQWLLKYLGVKPRINWSIDPFGHSGTVPYLWHLANFEGMIVQRIHQAIKDYLGHYKLLEYNWRQSWDTKGSHDILCHMMPYISYDATRTCGPSQTICSQFYFYGHGLPRMDEPGTPSYAEQMRAFTEPLHKQYRLKAANFQGNVIFVPLGGDFGWRYPHEFDRQYSSYKEVMAFMNSQEDWNIEVRFGTLTEYFKLLKETSPPIQFPTISGDFYVYSENPSHYWSGYFSSRPADKYLGREVESLLRVADALHILASLQDATYGTGYEARDTYNRLQLARRDLGLYQHHDAITGTAKPHVVRDYEVRLIHAYSILQNVSRDALASLLTQSPNSNNLLQLKTKSKPDVNFDGKSIFQIKSPWTNFIVFNPSTFRRAEVISILVDKRVDVELLSDTNTKVPRQISPIWDDDGTIDSHNLLLTFFVDIQPWSFATYRLLPQMNVDTHENIQLLSTNTDKLRSRINKDSNELPRDQNPRNEGVFAEKYNKEMPKEIVLENECLRLSFSLQTGLLNAIFHKQTETYTRVSMQMRYYTPDFYTGAYLFKPKKTESVLIENDVVVTFAKGSLHSYVKIVHPLFQTTIRLFNTTKSEVSCWAPSIENLATLGKVMDTELVMKFETTIQNRDVLYTDGNGLEMVKHKRFPKLDYAAAFYPMTSMVTIEDNNNRLTLHSAQPLGAASVRQGEVEVLLDRTMHTDDGKGLGQGIKNNIPSPSKFLLFLEVGIGHSGTDVGYINPTLESFRLNDILLNPLYSVSYDGKELKQTINTGLSKMPCDANLISFRPLPDSEPLLKTAFILQKRAHSCGSLLEKLDCSLDWSQFSFESLMSNKSPYSVKEMSLSFIDVKKELVSSEGINLSPMDIRSYSIDWKIK